MNNITSVEKAAEQRSAYRKTCEYRRKGARLEHFEEGRWEVFKIFTQKMKQGNKEIARPAVNAAKRYVRTNKLNSYTV